MAEFTDNSIKKASIELSRNRPVAFVVAAGTFLGSYLVEKLLNKDIQVVGVDNFEAGEKQNLLKASEDKNFHLVIESPEKLDLDLPRLDYLFIIPSQNWHISSILEILKKYRARCLLISSIGLYEADAGNAGLKWLSDIESKLAGFAAEHNLNARILRLGPLYGPKMDFRVADPMVKLIQQALTDNLQKNATLEFSSRALYISDAVDLAVKTIFAGSTSQKIFDGVSPTPIQVSEIKQVLLDPVWYESRDFTPTELPPWPTPNLNKTIKFLSWHPKAKLVASLKETLSYFKDNELVPFFESEIEVPEFHPEPEEKSEWRKEKKEVLEEFKKDKEVLKKSRPEDDQSLADKKGISNPKFPQVLSKIYLLGIVLLISYALIWPCLVLGWGIFTFRYQMDVAFQNLGKGEFDKSLISINQAQAGAIAAKSVFETLTPVRKTGILVSEFKQGDQLINLAILSAISAKESILGVQALLRSVKAITGELTESPAGYLADAQVKLTSASGDLSKAYAILNKENNQGILNKLAVYKNLVDKAQAISILLPKLVAVDGSKDYLVLLQNNMELRPGGGFIGSFAKVSFAGGKLKSLEVNDIYAIDGQLKIPVEPPKEIKEDLGQKFWFLRDSNFEPDFPTNARQAEWFYNQETGNRVEGVVALDISAMEQLLGVVGPLDLPDYNEKITSENLFAKSVTHAELSFFPGSQAKKSFLTGLTSGIFNKIFFLPQNNWPGIISALGKSLDESHISIYLNDPKLFSYVLSQNWAQVLPRASKENINQDFLSVIEANLGANKANYYLDRNYNLETVVGKDGDVKHRLRIAYTNRSPSDAFPGGMYKNRLRIYLPFGSKLVRALWGEKDITKSVTGFVDYGRSGYSMLLELAPKEQKNLVLDYSVPVKLEFTGNKAAYRLDIIKQAGTLKDPFQWTISYPLSYKLVSGQAKTVGPQETTISSDLSKSRSFEVEFSK